MRKTAIIALVLAFALPAAADDAAQAQAAKPAVPPPAVQHVPLHEAYAGRAELRLRVREPDRAGEIVVHCRPRAGARRVHTAKARRTAAQHRASVPLACAQPPGFDYWVVQRSAAGEAPLFASAKAPHGVRVVHTPERASELELLRAHGYKRSRVLLAAEAVSFGARAGAGDATLHDRYYRLEAGYGYAFFGRIEDIALTIVRVRGENDALKAEQSGQIALDPGIDYGRATVTLRATDFLRLRSALLLGASQEGFEYGASGELVLGDPLAEHLLLGAESLTTLGTTATLRLGFNATEKIPMGARVELTDFPLGEDAAVRLLYEVGYRFTPGTELLLRAGYQGRTSVIGGPSLGAALRYAF